MEEGGVGWGNGIGGRSGMGEWDWREDGEGWGRGLSRCLLGYWALTPDTSHPAGLCVWRKHLLWLDLMRLLVWSVSISSSEGVTMGTTCLSELDYCVHVH
jgi:hypothetical protein